MPSFYYDLWYLRAGIEQLKDYLLSDEIYWSIGVHPPLGEPPYPQFTLGWLLLANKRAEFEANTDQQHEEFVRLSENLYRIHEEWQSAWERKATQEFHARLSLWRDYLEEFRSSPEQHYDRYTYEVSRRVLLELLIKYASAALKADVELLKGLDKILQSKLIPSDFIWDENLKPGFDDQEFWFLYGQLPKRT